MNRCVRSGLIGGRKGEGRGNQGMRVGKDITLGRGGFERRKSVGLVLSIK